MPPRKNSLQLPTAALSASGKGSKLITSSQPASTSSPAFNQQDITREVQTTRREIKPLAYLISTFSTEILKTRNLSADGLS